jgi:hypothetical protein
LDSDSTMPVFRWLDRIEWKEPAIPMILMCPILASLVVSPD